MAVVDTLLQKLESHACLSDEDRVLLMSLPIRPKVVRAREDIAPQGTEPEHSVFIIEGVLVRYQEFPDGSRQTVSFHLKGEMPDLHSVFIQHMDHTLGALTDATIGMVRHEDIRPLLAKSLTLTQILWRETLIDAAIFRQWVANNGKRGALSGTAHLLCELITRAKAVGLLEADGTWVVPFTQQNFSEAVGLSLVHTNRTLRSLRKSELVEIEHGRLRVLNWNGLAEIAGFEPSYLHLKHADQIRANTFNVG